MGSNKFSAVRHRRSSQSCCGWRLPCLAVRSTAWTMPRSMRWPPSAPAYPFLTHAGNLDQLRGRRAGDDLPVLARRGVPWHGVAGFPTPQRCSAIVLGGRLMVEILKQSIGRPRPDLELHAVTVHSLSFPSGHAANSMIAFVAIALFCAPERRREAAVTLAIAASLVVGATRPCSACIGRAMSSAGGSSAAVGGRLVADPCASSLEWNRQCAVAPLFGERRQDHGAYPPRPRRTGPDRRCREHCLPRHKAAEAAATWRATSARATSLTARTGKDKGVTRVHKGDKPKMRATSPICPTEARPKRQTG